MNCRNHPDVKVRALGLCATCYEKQRIAGNPVSRAKVKASTERYRENHREELRRKGKIDQKRIRIEQKSAIIKGYGGECNCCGEKNREFLTIDHIDGVPKDHPHRDDSQRNRRKSGLYGIIIREGFPDEYRLLCWNCNCSRGIYGYCPHD